MLQCYDVKFVMLVVEVVEVVEVCVAVMVLWHSDSVSVVMTEDGEKFVVSCHHTSEHQNL